MLQFSRVRKWHFATLYIQNSNLQHCTRPFMHIQNLREKSLTNINYSIEVCRKYKQTQLNNLTRPVIWYKISVQYGEQCEHRKFEKVTWTQSNGLPWPDDLPRDQFMNFNDVFSISLWHWHLNLSTHKEFFYAIQNIFTTASDGTLLLVKFGPTF